MFGLATLDVMIGLVTVYLVFGLACTAIIEAFAAWLNVRSSNLEEAMKEFLSGDIKDAKKFVDAFYDHPLVQALSKGKDGRPSYIPPEIVGQVVEALVTANGVALSLADAVKALPGTTESNRIKGLLDALVTQASGDAAKFRTAVETHFNVVMDRASGWVKRRQQTVGLIVAALLVIGANVDTVGLATSFASSPEARAAMVKTAEEVLKKAKDETAKAQAGVDKTKVDDANKPKPDQENILKQAQEKTEDAQKVFDNATTVAKSSGLQLGWKFWWTDIQNQNPSVATIASEVVAKLVGLLVSIFAVSLGAPFWFDILQRFMQLRTTGPREATAQKK